MEGCLGGHDLLEGGQDSGEADRSVDDGLSNPPHHGVDRHLDVVDRDKNNGSTMLKLLCL